MAIVLPDYFREIVKCYNNAVVMLKLLKKIIESRK